MPNAYPVNEGKFDSWKHAMKGAGYPESHVLTKPRRVSFERFLEGFEAQMQGVMKVLADEADPLCRINTFRKGSGKSADDTYKSFSWMLRLFNHYRTWLRLSRGTSSSEVLPLDKCIQKDEEKGCAGIQANAVTLILEDVSYSGEELIRTTKALLNCSEKPKMIIVSMSYYTTTAQDKVNKDELWRLETPLFFPWNLTSTTEFVIPNDPGPMPTPVGRWIYFDHKMADWASLSENEKYASGQVVTNEIDGTVAVPYIKKCEHVHGCRAGNAKWAKYIDSSSTCDPGRLQCPYPPYWNIDEMLATVRNCKCDSETDKEVCAWRGLQPSEANDTCVRAFGWSMCSPHHLIVLQIFWHLIAYL